MSNIKEVARRAGVSISTVSRALSGRVFVKDETRERILEAVKELKYTPNLIAQGLKEGRSRTIALILPNITNPIFPKLVKQIEKRAAERGFTLVLFDSDEDREAEVRCVEAMGAHFVGGVLLISATDDIAHAEALREDGIPLVVVNRDFDVDVQCVSIDNRAGAYTVAKHLIGLGHQRIACLMADTGMQRFRHRREGCVQAMREHHIKPPVEYWVDKIGTIDEAYAATNRLLDLPERPTAIFSFMDLLTFGVYSAIAGRGLTIPGDISVAGFDNIDISPYMIPPLTTYALPVDGIAAAAVEALAAKMDKSEGAETGNIIVGGDLLVRHSTGPVPGTL